MQTEQEMEVVKTVWASVEPVRGREYQEAQRIRPELTYKITTRYHKEVTPDMFIKYKDRYFNIISVINVRERNEMLEIVCTEKIMKK
ncbi:MAG: phage head closure protein [Lachnospiraceae bacterium]|nr:phage head closure protein [Lachnospiraceae bacterium]